MGLDKVVVHLNLNVSIHNDNYPLDLSLAMLTDIHDNVRFLSQLPPLPVDSKIKDKVNYKEGYRKVRVLRAFKRIPLTRELEIRRGLEKGVYDSTSLPINSVWYDVTDFAVVEGRLFENATYVGYKSYTAEKVVRLRNLG